MAWSFLINEQNWSRRVESYLSQPITVYKEALTNNHYEGDVKGKASLKIRSFGELTYGDYNGIGLESTWWNALTETEQTINVDQVKYSNFVVPDPDQTTTEANLVEEGSMKLAYQISRMYDDYLATEFTQIVSNIYGASGAGAWGGAGGQSGTGPIVVGFNATAGNILPTVALANMYEMLVANNADLSGVNAVVPAWMGNFLLQELGVRFTPTGDDALEGKYESGYKLPIPKQMISGFSGIWVSNLVPNTNNTNYRIMVGSPSSAITFASHLETVETVRIQSGFGTGVKALTVFGSRVPFEGHMALGTFNRGDARTGIVII